MTTRRPIVRQGGQNRQLPSGDDIGLPRAYQQDTPPGGTRVNGDRWWNTESGVEYEWLVTASGGQWVELQSAGPLTTVYTTPNDIEVTDASRGLILRSPNGTRWRVTIDNAGTLTRTSL